MGSHFVPQYYLKGFECPGESGLIWMYDKRSMEFHKIPIRTAAQRPAFYDEETERGLCSVEGPAHAALGRLRRGENVLPSQWAALSLYIAVMLMRVPFSRHRALRLLPEVVEKIVKGVSLQVEDWAEKAGTDPGLAERRRREVASFRDKALREPFPEIMNQVNSPWPSQRVIAAVSSMNWRILSARQKNPFLTSDNPAFYFQGEGVGRPESEISFPISSELALLGSRHGVAGQVEWVPTKRSLVEEVNRRTASCADRFILCCEDKEWIPRLASKKHPRLKRIQWQ